MDKKELEKEVEILNKAFEIACDILSKQHEEIRQRLCADPKNISFAPEVITLEQIKKRIKKCAIELLNE